MQQKQEEIARSIARPFTVPAIGSILPVQGEPNPLPEAVLNRIEDYLDHVCAPLVAQVPLETRHNWRGEMRTHLEALTIAYIELGELPEEAVENALKQFGPFQTVSKQWQQEWERIQTGPARAGFRASLRTAVTAWSASHALFALFLCITVGHYSTRLIPFWSEFAAGTLMFGLPVITGGYIGLRARQRPVVSALLGYGLTMPVIALLSLLYLFSLHTFQSAHHISGLGTVAWPLALKLGFCMYFHLLCVLPIGVASAGVMALGLRIRTLLRRQLAFG